MLCSGRDRCVSFLFLSTIKYIRPQSHIYVALLLWWNVKLCTPAELLMILTFIQEQSDTEMNISPTGAAFLPGSSIWLVICAPPSPTPLPPPPPPPPPSVLGTSRLMDSFHCTDPAIISGLHLMEPH